MFGLFGKKKGQVADAPLAASQNEALARIIPVVKAMQADQDDPARQTVTLTLAPEDSPMSRPLVSDLIVMYAEDFPDRLEFVSLKRMQALGLSADELHALALHNLPSRLPEIQLHGESPRFMVTCGGTFEATLLLYDALWDSIAQSLPGQAMATVPARDLLYVTGADWDGAHSFLSEMANQDLADPRYALSKRVLIRSEGSWIVGGALGH